MRRIHLALTAVIAFLSASAGAQPVAPITISRTDWMRALIRFERAYAAHPPAPDQRVHINQEYDIATRLYYSARHAEAIGALNALANSIAYPKNPPAAEELITSLQVRVAPDIAQRPRPSILRVRVAPMYPVKLEQPVTLKLVIRADAPNSKPIVEENVQIEQSGAPVTVARSQPDAPVGRYLIELIGPDGVVHPAGAWAIVENPLEFIRVNNDRQMLAIQPGNAEMFHALVAARARNLLVSDRIDPNNSAQFLADPIQMASQVQLEVATLLQGKDPYFRRSGDWWRAILAGQMNVPVRIYAPAQINNGKPLPLVIALAEAAGDENTFLEVMANGRLKQLADDRGFVVAAPNTAWTLRNLATLDALVEAMSCIYPIEKTRVYVLGHALGAEAAIAMAGNQPDKIARVVLFGGGTFSNPGIALPATRLYYGAIDPVYAPGPHPRIVEIKEVEQRGHTLVVHDKLEEAVDWLLGQ